MRDDTDGDEAPEANAVLRLTTLVLGSAEVIAFLLFAHLMLQSSDPLGSAIGWGMTLLIAVPVIVFSVPGLLLASLNRAPRAALGLVLLALPLAGVLWYAA